ncbi:MAG: polyprenyl synthetase family protein, partial [Pseudomonadota bacterium]
GKPSCHKAYDEATAILAGDGLQAKAFELLAEAKGFSATQRLTMIQVLSKAAGFDGMVGGQAIDIAAAQSSLTLQQLKTMHSLKTGALIQAALALGAIAAEAETTQRTALESFGAQIGLAFQIVDDILDVEGNTATLGKTGGKDSEANKPTYVQLLGLIDAKSEARKLFSLALQSLQDFDGSANPLRQLASYVIERDR